MNAEDVQLTTQEVLGGTPSGASQNAVVAVLSIDGPWGSGVLISPTLVLTARHLLFDSTEETSLYFECDADTSTGAPVKRALDPTRFRVDVGAGYPFKKEYTGKRVYAGADLDLCANDLAILELDEAVDEAQPRAIRLAGPGARHVSIGEQGVLVGWGSTDDDDDARAPGFHGERDQLPLTVVAVGRVSFPVRNRKPIEVLSSSFLTSQGGCHGDSGAPFIADETGAVVGVFSSFEPADPVGAAHVCTGSNSVFRNLTDQSDWIREAFVQAGQAPWVEGHPKPAAPGDACQANDDCTSGLCETSGGAGFCSLACDADSCPSSMECVAVPSGSHFCVPSRLAVSGESSAACAIGTPRRLGRRNAFWAALVLSAFGLRRWPRQRRKHALERECQLRKGKPQ